MNLALQRRRLWIAMGITAAAIVVALIATVGAFGLHVGWMVWLFGAAIAVGFGSHGWLMLGVLRDKAAS